MIAVTSGLKEGCWILFLEPGHPGLQESSPTLTTGVVDGTLSIVVRPDIFSAEFAGPFLTHELLHAYIKLYKPQIPASAEEFYAYDAERRALSLIAAGKLESALRDTSRQFELHDGADLLKLKSDNPGRLIEVIQSIEGKLAFPPPASVAERQMRDGLYFLILATQLAEERGVPFEGRVDEMNALLSEISLHESVFASPETN
jgi:hypothetical protein